MGIPEKNNDMRTVGFDGEIVWRPLDALTYRRMRADGEIYTREIMFRQGIASIRYIGDRDIIAADDEWVLCEGKLPRGLEFDRGFIYGITSETGEYDLRYRVLMRNVGIYEVRVHLIVEKIKKICWQGFGIDHVIREHPENKD